MWKIFFADIGAGADWAWADCAARVVEKTTPSNNAGISMSLRTPLNLLSASMDGGKRPSSTYLSLRVHRRHPLAFVALIAVNAVVHIPADVRVMEIGRDPTPMANGALEIRIVRGTRMAGRAHAVCIAMIDRKVAVRERCP